MEKMRQRRQAANARSEKFVTLDKLEDDLVKMPGMKEVIEEEHANLLAAEGAADFIKKARLSAHLSQAELAKKLNISQARVSQMENGDAPFGASVACLIRVAEACGGRMLMAFEKTLKTVIPVAVR
jgi:DNA-binding transcriptional regulator YiaG